MRGSGRAGRGASPERPIDMQRGDWGPEKGCLCISEYTRIRQPDGKGSLSTGL